ncbi:Embryogenesis-associated protein EMB8 [Linum perenne]
MKSSFPYQNHQSISSSAMDGCVCATPGSVFPSPYDLLFKALSLIPLAHYAALLLSIILVFLYNFLEIHFLHDFRTAFRGNPVKLTYNASSELCRSIVSQCHVLRGRYLPTLWLCSPHLQTAFLTFFGNAPRFTYKRVLFCTSDGGTIALDWLLHSHVNGDATDNLVETVPQKTDPAPILIVIPGLTSDSDAPVSCLWLYAKHLVYKMAKQGWNVVVTNHRGLGGVQITSDCFYNAGWTEDTRRIIDHIHQEYPDTPLYVVGTSIGANVLVKYLGEDGVNVPVLGAVGVCSPWDLTIGDRFISRKFAQRVYDKALAFGLIGYAKLYSRSIRDFDNYVTCIVGKFETVDTYYRRSSSVNFVGNVAVPLLCISALDDPVCTREAIPWDECRMNPNIVLAATEHGGHLAYFQGLTARTMWWVRATSEFLEVLRSSPLKDRPKRVEPSSTTSPLESKIDQVPFINVMDDGTVAAVADIQKDHAAEADPSNADDTVKDDREAIISEEEETSKDVATPKEMYHESNPEPPSDQKLVSDLIDPIKRQITQLRRHSRTSIWLLSYIAIVTTWPVLGSGLLFFLRKRSRRRPAVPSR